eukprot:5337583-Heterocapsa_arctica.AAC.1
MARALGKSVALLLLVCQGCQAQPDAERHAQAEPRRALGAPPPPMSWRTQASRSIGRRRRRPWPAGG